MAEVHWVLRYHSFCAINFLLQFFLQMENSQYLGIAYNGQHFTISETKGDGNCLFHTILASKTTGFKDSLNLRTHVYGQLTEWITTDPLRQTAINMAYGILSSEGEPLDRHLEKMKKNGEWASSIDMVFASLVLNMNICSISNMPSKFEVFSTERFLQQIKFNFSCFKKCSIEEQKTIYVYHHAFGDYFRPSAAPNHFSLLSPFYRTIESHQWYDRTTRVESCEEDLKESIKVKQTTLTNWFISGIEAERMKLIRMEQEAIERIQLEEEVEKICAQTEDPEIKNIECVKAVSRVELSWNQRAQRIYVYLHPELANKKMSILRWAYPNLSENTFKNWLKRHDMMSKWLPIIEHLKAEDVIKNLENDAAKPKLLRFLTGTKTINIEPYSKRLPSDQSVVLVASERKLVPMLVNKAKKHDNLEII